LSHFQVQQLLSFQLDSFYHFAPATAFEAWLRIPHCDDTVIYSSPTTSDTSDTQLAFPAVVLESHLFAITAHNPFGELTDAAVNVAQNQLLHQRLLQMRQEMKLEVKFITNSFGFSHDWREDGFLIAVAANTSALTRSALIALAIEFRQGAIYEYQSVRDQTSGIVNPFLLRRLTVPAALNNVAAEVLVQRSTKPPFECADPLWQPNQK
jgi:hypothetical protein